MEVPKKRRLLRFRPFNDEYLVHYENLRLNKTDGPLVTKEGSIFSKVLT